MPEVLPITSMSDSNNVDYSTFENKSGLADDMKFLASMPELCDVTFLVGETREPVCAVKVSALFLFFSANRQHFKCFPFSGGPGLTLARLPEAALPAAVAAAQEGAAAAREQAAPVPEALVGAAAQPAERRPAGTVHAKRFHPRSIAVGALWDAIAWIERNVQGSGECADELRSL